MIKPLRGTNTAVTIAKKNKQKLRCKPRIANQKRKVTTAKPYSPTRACTKQKRSKIVINHNSTIMHQAIITCRNCHQR